MLPNKWRFIKSSVDIKELHHGQAQAAERSHPYMSEEISFPRVS
jgi:hypothetical protein